MQYGLPSRNRTYRSNTYSPHAEQTVLLKDPRGGVYVKSGRSITV
jgi:hypothetical protein